MFVVDNLQMLTNTVKNDINHLHDWLLILYERFCGFENCCVLVATFVHSFTHSHYNDYTTIHEVSALFSLGIIVFVTFLKKKDNFVCVQLTRK